MSAQPNMRLVFNADARAAKYKSRKAAAAACVQHFNFSYLGMEKGKKKESVQLWTHTYVPRAEPSTMTDI